LIFRYHVRPSLVIATRSGDIVLQLIDLDSKEFRLVTK
jgi:hypothetical protein